MAFGYPGATSAGTQSTVVGGRVEVGSAEGELYSLDVKTDCVTDAPALYAARLYMPVSSRKESQVGNPKYPCCRFGEA